MREQVYQLRDGRYILGRYDRTTETIRARDGSVYGMELIGLPESRADMEPVVYITMAGLKNMEEEK